MGLTRWLAGIDGWVVTGETDWMGGWVCETCGMGWAVEQVVDFEISAAQLTH